ncbi:hypothetical protein TL10_28170 [Mycolicibacterium llatzerense]|uniref:Uncharacterized protein n=1 Tax=Mycolicibacterium llatzerense TaxID=280871 RepID=A0A0D1L5V8_9MYCO|nr:hypothetical protein TL10_28170 [Mycolicibacterium llatzerense]
MLGGAGTAFWVVVEGSAAATAAGVVLVAVGVTAETLAAGLGLVTRGFDVTRGRDEEAPVVDVAAPGDCLPADFVAGLMLAGDRLPLACGVARLLPACAVELTAEEAGPPAVSWPESLSADATAVPVVSPTPMMAAASPPMPHRPALTVIVCVYVTAARAAA